MGDPVRCLPKVVHPDVAALKLQHNPRTYNELRSRAGMQDGLNVQLPGLAGSHIGWGLNDPVDVRRAGGRPGSRWSSG